MSFISRSPAPAPAGHSVPPALAAWVAAAGWLCLALPARAQGEEPIRPIPVEIKVDARKAALGEKLFHDKRLSVDDSVACATCHPLERGGVDGLVVSVGVGGARGVVNALTVYNSVFNFRQFWDGHASSLEEQAAGPVHNPLEMGSSWSEVVAKLARDPALVAAFKASYGDGVRPGNIQDALATFERGATSQFVGIGVQLAKDGDAIKIVAPLPGSPAEEAGILPDDVLLSVAGEEVTGKELSDVVKQVAGKAGVKIAVKVRHADGQEEQFEIVRGTVKVPSVEGLRRQRGLTRHAVIGRVGTRAGLLAGEGCHAVIVPTPRSRGSMAARRPIPGAAVRVSRSGTARRPSAARARERSQSNCRRSPAAARA